MVQRKNKKRVSRRGAGKTASLPPKVVKAASARPRGRLERDSEGKWRRVFPSEAAAAAPSSGRPVRPKNKKKKQKQKEKTCDDEPPSAASASSSLCRPKKKQEKNPASYSLGLRLALGGAVTYLTCREKMLCAALTSRYARSVVESPGSWPVVDFLEFRAPSAQWQLAMLVWRLKPMISRLRIHLGLSERALLFAMLPNGTALRRLDVCFSNVGDPLSTGLVETGHVFDVDDDAPADDHGDAMRALSGVLGGPVSEQEEEDPIAELVRLCPNLAHLRLSSTRVGANGGRRYEIGDLSGADLGHLGGLLGLTTLDTNFQLALVEAALPSLPAIVTLRLSTGAQGVTVATLRSSTLEVLDCHRVAKGNWLSGLDCPKLKILNVPDHEYCYSGFAVMTPVITRRSMLDLDLDDTSRFREVAGSSSLFVAPPFGTGCLARREILQSACGYAYEDRTGVYRSIEPFLVASDFTIVG